MEIAIKTEVRTCAICQKVFLDEGYVYRGGERYYCSDECLSHDFTPEEWSDEYNDNFGCSYWTTFP